MQIGSTERSKPVSTWDYSVTDYFDCFKKFKRCALELRFLYSFIIMCPDVVIGDSY